MKVEPILPTIRFILVALTALLILFGGAVVFIPFFCPTLNEFQTNSLQHAGDWSKLILGLLVGVAGGAVGKSTS